MKKIVMVIALLALTGCGNLGYIIKTYDSSTTRSEFDYQGETYRIFDRKDLSKVMITASMGSAALNGAARGATFGAVNIDDDQTRYTSVATAYLSKDRANQLCKIVESRLLITPQWEFVYLCAQDKQVLTSH